MKMFIKRLKKIVYLELCAYHLKKAYKYKEYETAKRFHVDKSNYYFKEGQL
jgi:hypothetical protein